MYIISFIRGFFGTSRQCSGVSGGTIAFVRLYDEFINSLNFSVISNIKEDKKGAIKFLSKIGIGWITGFVLSILFIASVFETHIYKISSLFIGFILFSIPIVFKEERKEIIGKYKNIIFAIIGFLIVVAITYFNPSTNSGGMDLSMGNLNIGLAIYIFVCGAIAICAMVLPGISGSTLLLIFGLYVPIISAIKEFLSFDFSYMPYFSYFWFRNYYRNINYNKIIKICFS